MRDAKQLDMSSCPNGVGCSPLTKGSLRRKVSEAGGPFSRKGTTVALAMGVGLVVTPGIRSNGGMRN